MTSPVRVAARRRDAAAAFQHDQQILDRAVAQGVGQDDAFADQLVAFGDDDDDIASARDLAGARGPR